MFNTDKATIELDINNVFIVTYKDKVEVTKEDVEGFTSIFYELVKDRNSLKLLSISGQNTTITKEAREYSQDLKLPVSKEALVANSLAQKIIANFYLKIKKNQHPISVFTDKDQAYNWLIND